MTSDPAFVLTRDELHFLRFTCDLWAADESPLGPLDPLEDAAALESAARALADRGLLDRSSYRPNRELIRRLLVVSQPDARVVLLSSDSKERVREVDVYERAGAFVPYRKDGDDQHELSATIELPEVIGRVLARFKPRRSRGDYVELILETDEYFVLSMLAADLVGQPASAARQPTPRTEEISLHAEEPPTKKNIGLSGAGPSAPVRSALAEETEGTPIHALLQRLPTRSVITSGLPADSDLTPPSTLSPPPGREEWERAIASLVDKNVVGRSGERCFLRPYLHDLARGLAGRARLVLTRFDFGSDDWLVRDATFVAVPGSIFWVRAAREGWISISELDGRALETAIKATVEPLTPDLL